MLEWKVWETLEIDSSTPTLGLFGPPLISDSKWLPDHEVSS